MGALALVAVPALKGVTEAIQAKSAAEKEATSASDAGAAASARAAQQALTMASAQDALAKAHRNAGRSIASANRSVEDAERSLGQAAARAMEQRRDAAKAVEQAEESLADAKRDSLRAEEALTQARKDATQQLEDLNDRLASGALDEREAALRVQEAYEELQSTIADPTATDLQRQRAQLSYDEALQSQKEQQKEYRRLQQEAAAASKAGVDGNENVTQAAQQLADAQSNVADQADAVADAQRNAAQVQADSAQSVADAQRALSDAVQSAADAQVDAAESIESAERGIESARLSSADATTQAASQADAYRQALDKLTPSQRAVYDSLAGPQGLIPAFKAWSTSLQPDVLPLFERLINGAKKSLPGLTPLVKSSADGVGELMDRASADIKRPFWQRFKQGIAENAKPAIVGFGVAFGNTFKGMAGIVDAFLPNMDSISVRLQESTGEFADWGTNLRGSPEFESFLDYVRDRGPIVSEAFGSIAGGMIDVAKALEPFSTVILQLLGYAADGIGYVAEHAPWAIQLIYGLWVATKLWSLAMSMSPVGAIVMGIVALALAVKYAWDNWDWFREAAIAAWAWIRDVSVDVWVNCLQPFFEWFGGIVMWLWDVIIKPYIGFMIDYWTQVGEVVWWLWEQIFSPVFGFIGDLIVWWWNNIVERYFGYVMDILGAVGGVFKWLYDHGVKPPLENIADVAKWLWDKALKPAFRKIQDGVGAVSDAFGSAKKSVKTAWGEIAKTAASPVNWIIDTVYNKGIKKLFEKVSSYVGMDPLPAGPKLLQEPKGFARGGILPGVSSWRNGDDQLVPMRKGEGVYVSEAMRDPFERARLHAVNRAAMRGESLSKFRPSGYAEGGIVGGIWDWTTDKVSDVVGTGIDWVKTAADLMTDPGKVWSKLTKPLVDNAQEKLGSDGLGGMLAKLPSKMVGGLKNKIVDAVANLLSADGGGWGGVWQKPVNAAAGTKFGVAGSMWSSGHHTGLDFPAPTGTPVRAVANGRVSTATSGGPYGKHVIIDHGGGLQSLYAHLSKIRTTVPKSHNAGSRIGDVGATGNVTGPHLHLEARLNGRPVDPMKYLSGGNGAQAVGAAQQYAKSILGNYGWGQSQFAPLKSLWQGESGWRWNADNPTSDAYGIPQALPGSKMASAGADWRTNYKTQIRWGLGYIKGRPDYGSPSAAYSKWLSRSPHWYDDGGYIPPGLSLVANGTGKPEPVFTDSQWSTLASAKGGGGPVTVNVESHTYLDGREVTGIIDRRINVYDAETGRALSNGRY